MNNRLKVSITGKNPDYFIKELIHKRINLYYIEKKDKKVELIMNASDYEKLLEMKTTYQIKIIEYYGVRKYKMILKRYFYLIFFSVIGIIINIILSHLVFSIEVSNPSQKVVKTVLQDLQELGLRKYHWKVTYEEKEKIKEKLLKKEPDLVEWIEIEEYGTKYIVKVEERKKNKEEEICNPRNIVARKNAVLLDINASSGEIVKKKKDYVEVGETIISGLIYNKDKVVSKKCATGEVYGETWYKMKITIPKEKETIKILDSKKIGLSLKTPSKEYNIGNKFSTFQKSVYNIIESKILKIHFGLAIYRKTAVERESYTSEKIEKMALDIAEKKMKESLEKEENVIQKKVLKKKEKNSKIEVEVFLKVKENITDYVDITDIEIEMLQEEKE